LERELKGRTQLNNDKLVSKERLRVEGVQAPIARPRERRENEKSKETLRRVRASGNVATGDGGTLPFSAPGIYTQALNTFAVAAEEIQHLHEREESEVVIDMVLAEYGVTV
jgi:hypothetical protein